MSQSSPMIQLNSPCLRCNLGDLFCSPASALLHEAHRFSHDTICQRCGLLHPGPSRGVQYPTLLKDSDRSATMCWRIISMGAKSKRVLCRHEYHQWAWPKLSEPLYSMSMSPFASLPCRIGLICGRCMHPICRKCPRANSSPSQHTYPPY